MIKFRERLVDTCSFLIAVTNIEHVHRCLISIFSLYRSSSGVLKAINLSKHHSSGRNLERKCLTGIY
jgi:hypothetical protein